MGVPVGGWSELTDLEYLRHFVRSSGSAVKFAIADDELLSDAQFRLRTLATAQGYLYVEVDGAATRLNLIQDFFFALSHKIDWEGLAQRRMESLFEEHGFKWPEPGSAATLADVSRLNEVAPNLVTFNIDQWLTSTILRDPEMAQDFREAMAHLCRNRLMGDVPTASDSIKDWLRGELRTLGAIRPVPVGAKIARHNARAMLRSLCRWLTICGLPGLVVVLDVRWLAERGVSSAGIRFTPASILDVFEVIRQLIDESERLEGLFLVVEAGQALLDGEDPRRTLDKYPALKGRVGLDVRAAQHDNPVAPLVRLGRDEHETSLRTNGAKPFSTERVAIEALRAGVPNEAAIRLLGASEDDLCNRFVDELRTVARAVGDPSIFEGRIVLGGFGTGKSHLLGYLAQLAQNQNFIVSPIAISKETPLYSPEKVYAAAVRNAIVPGINDDVMSVAIARLDPATPEFRALEEWASSSASGLSPLFPALLYVLSRHVLGPEDKTAIARFLSGARIGAGKVGGWLKAAGARKLFQVRPVKAPQLALQRLRFAPALFRAAGFSGWCVLLDEGELIGRYSTLQRGKSYAELSRWLNLDPSTAIPGLLSVATLVDDFPSVVLRDRLDEERIPALLDAKDLPDMKRMAVTGMHAIDRTRHFLTPPDSERLKRDLNVVARLYERGYDWSPPNAGIGEQLGSKTMREYIKSWITDWDIQRFYDSRDTIITEPQTSNLDEDKDFETAPKETPEDDA